MRRQSYLARAEAMLHKESAIITPSEQGFVHRQAAHAGKMSERGEELRILKVRVMMHARTNILAKVSDLERHTSRILLAAIHSGSDHHHAYQRALYVSIDRISGGVDYCKQASKVNDLQTMYTPRAPLGPAHETIKEQKIKSG